MKKSILEVVYESAKDLNEIGLIDEEKMQEFEKACRGKKPKSMKSNVKKRGNSDGVLAVCK